MAFKIIFVNSDLILYKVLIVVLKEVPQKIWATATLMKGELASQGK